MKTFRKLREDMGGSAGPTNVAGSGAIAGIGQPAGSHSGEPGVDMKKKKKVVLQPMASRLPPKA